MTMEEIPEKALHPPLSIRRAVMGDLETLASLLVRLKRLNSEFDPLLSVRTDAQEVAVRVLRTDIADPSALVLSVEGSGDDTGKVIGIARGALRERSFYSPVKEGVILDIYLMPAYRRSGCGAYLLRQTIEHLKQMGAGIVTAEFPSQNVIAVKFYAKHGFRPITSLHAKGV